jgi:hypothetical protein
MSSRSGWGLERERVIGSEMLPANGREFSVDYSYKYKISYMARSSTISAAKRLIKKCRVYHSVENTNYNPLNNLKSVKVADSVNINIQSFLKLPSS